MRNEYAKACNYLLKAIVSCHKSEDKYFSIKLPHH